MTTPKTGAPELSVSQASKEATVNEQARRIEAGAGYYLVEDKDLSSPPGSCADGATYIVAATGSGAWAGHTGDLAIAVGTNAANGWYFRDPEEGVLARVKDEDLWYYCSAGTSPATWAELTAALLGGVSTSTLTESVQDIVGAMVSAGAGISVSYDDSSGVLTVTNTGGGGGGGSAGGGVTTQPQGRLTLTSQTPIMTADVTGASSVYYTPHVGEHIPIYESGSPLGWTMTEFAQLTLSLDGAQSPPNHASGSLYDVFVWSDAGTVRIGTGPAWTSSTARGTGAATTEITRVDGLWVNANAIDLINGTTVYSSIPTNEATYVGTIYCTAAGQTGMAFLPAAAAGGTGNVLGVYNAYNRATVRAVSRDNTASWSYNSSTIRSANASDANRISFVDGLAQSSVEAVAHAQQATSSTAAFWTGLGYDSTSVASILSQTDDLASGQNASCETGFLPALGFHYVQALEATSGSVTFFGSRSTPTGQMQLLKVVLEM